MSMAMFLVLILNLAYIGLLPRIFFRRDGRLNVKWWLTATPFFLSGALLILQYFGQVQPWYARAFSHTAEGIAAVLAVASTALISYALGTHRRRLSLWHQDNDAPEEIVT